MTSRLHAHSFRLIIHYVSFVLLLIAIVSWVFFLGLVTYEFSQRGTQGVVSKIFHLTSMTTDNFGGGWKDVLWVYGGQVAGTVALAVIYVKTRKH